MEDSVPLSGAQLLLQSQQPPSSASGGPHIRSRVTVVCAECKRLKLKCDRRTPCGSCTKRDTVARCVYSPAAAEKVDLHSLHNRLIQVESQLAQFTASGGRLHVCHSKAPGSSAHNDRAVLAVGKSGSSLSVSLDDITTIWLDELDIGRDVHPVQPSQCHPSGSPSSNSSQIKMESLSSTLTGQESGGLELPVPLLLPSPSTYFVSQSPSPHEAPTVTPRLMTYLPFAPRKRQKLYDNVEDVLKMHPCFNFKHFKDRSEAMFRWAAEGDTSDGIRPDASPSSRVGPQPAPQKAELARAIFFGPPSPLSPSKGSNATQPTLSFFAAAAAAFALGMLVDREVADEDARILAAVHSDWIVGDDSGRPPSRRRPAELPSQGRKCKGFQKDAASSPAVLLSLSQQALSLFEKSNLYDLDFLVTMILHVLYTLHDSKARVARHLLPDVGKMVNIARTMGLDVDPAEFPGTFSLFEAELRRRLWWDTFYYDVFVSDYMGRAPLISDTEHTTRLPMDVDEDVFTPACTSIPLPRSPLSPLEPNASDFKYFGLKCRLAQLIKDIKKRSVKDSLQNDPEAQEHCSLDQAMACASEIKQWLSDLPAPFRLDIDPDTSGPQVSQHDAASLLTPPSPSESAAVSPVLLAQRCELMVTAQRLIMKVYIPFLRPSNSNAGPTTHYQATVSIFTAAHTIIRAIKVLCSMWKQRPDLKGKRPTPALFRFYSFGRTLFDAAVACAHNVIKDPTSVWVRTAIEDVNYALEVMRDPMMNTGRGPMRGGVEGDVHEGIRITELLLEKAEAVRRGDMVVVGTKRKRDDGEADSERPASSSKMPFTGRSATSSDLDCPPLLTPHLGPTVAIPDPTGNPKSKDASPTDEPLKSLTPPAPPRTECMQSAPRDSKCKDKRAKKASHPQTGIRIRPGREGPPFYRMRSSSASSASPEPTTESTLASSAPPPPPSQTPSTPSTECRLYPLQSSFAHTLQKPSSPGALKIHHQKVSQDAQNDRNVDFQVPDNDAAQTRASGPLSQAQQYMGTEGTDTEHFSKMPSRTPYQQSRTVPYQGNNYPTPSPYGTSGPGSLPCPPMSRAPSSHHQPSTPFATEMPGPPQNYYQYNPRFEGSVNGASLVDLGISPSMTFRNGDEGAHYAMDDAVSRAGLFHHRQEKSHQQPVYLTKPQNHLSAASQPQFPASHPQPVGQSWPQENAMQDNGFWRTPYDHFMPP